MAGFKEVCFKVFCLLSLKSVVRRRLWAHKELFVFYTQFLLRREVSSVLDLNTAHGP